MIIAVTGHKGRLGSALIAKGLYPLECDISNEDSVFNALVDIKPNVIIHCAAITDVDYCEAHPKEAFDINVRGVNNIIRHFTGTFIYVSSCHVFSGKKLSPRGYSEFVTPKPVNIYGYTKWMGEEISSFRVRKTLVIRTSKLFDYKYLDEDLRYLENDMGVEFTNLIKRSFVYTPHFVNGLMWVVDNLDKCPSILHIAGTHIYSYYGFWLAVAKVYKLDKELVIPRDYKLKDVAPRPFRGGLNIGLAKRLGVPLYSAVDGIKRMKKDGRK